MLIQQVISIFPFCNFTCKNLAYTYQRNYYHFGTPYQKDQNFEYLKWIPLYILHTNNDVKSFDPNQKLFLQNLSVHFAKMQQSSLKPKKYQTMLGAKTQNEDEMRMHLLKYTHLTKDEVWEENWKKRSNNLHRHFGFCTLSERGSSIPGKILD